MTTSPLTVRSPGRRPGAPLRQSLDMPGDWRGLQDAQRDGQSRGLLVPQGAGWVQHDSLGVAEEVSQRWPNLRVAKCEKGCVDCAVEGHYPYTVVELTVSNKAVPILGFMRLDRSVIDTLWSISAEQHDTQRLADEHNERVRAEIARKQHEHREAMLEVIGAALKSNKFDWIGPGGVKIGPHMTAAEARRALTQR